MKKNQGGGHISLLIIPTLCICEKIKNKVTYRENIPAQASSKMSFRKKLSQRDMRTTLLILWESSVGKGAWHQGWTEFNPQDTHGGSRKLTPTSCTAVCRHMLWHMHKPACTQMHRESINQ